MESLLWIAGAISIVAIGIVWLEARRITRRRQRWAIIHRADRGEIDVDQAMHELHLAVDEPLSPGCAVCERDAREVRH